MLLHCDPQRLHRACGNVDIHAAGAQPDLHHPSQVGIVIHEQDLRKRRRWLFDRRGGWRDRRLARDFGHFVRHRQQPADDRFEVRPGVGPLGDVVGAQRLAALDRRRVRCPRAEHDGDRPHLGVAEKLLRNAHPADRGHVDVEDEKIRLLPRERRDR